MFKNGLLILDTAVFCLACGFPEEQRAKSDVKSANPSIHPISAMAGEGHGDAVYYHIKYKKPNDEKTYEQVWLYPRQDDGKFKLTNKEREEVIE